MTEFPPIATAALALAWGATMASFAGVVVHRTPAWFGLRGDAGTHIPLHKPSRCEGCGRRLRAIELIPVLGWLLTRGRCFSCDHAIPRRYPIIEGAIGALCLGIALLVPDPLEALRLCLLAPVLLLLAWFDWNEKVVPDLFAGILAVVAAIPAVIAGRDPLDMIAGGVVSALVVGLAVWLPVARRQGVREATRDMAWGDVTLAIGLGLATGAALAPWAWLAAGVLHAGLFLATRRGRKALARGEPMPMGPALCAGTMLALLVVGATGAGG